MMSSLQDGKLPSCNRKSFAQPSTHREKGLPQQRSNINKGQVGGGREGAPGGRVAGWSANSEMQLTLSLSLNFLLQGLDRKTGS